MFHIPAHKQLDPAKRPAQRVLPSRIIEGACVANGGGYRFESLFHAAAVALVAKAESDLDVLCPACDGYPEALGQLGRLTHYRCRDCAWVFADR